jgi:hypothetical protein
MTRYHFVPARPDYPAASVAHFRSAALNRQRDCDFYPNETEFTDRNGDSRLAACIDAIEACGFGGRADRDPEVDVAKKVALRPQRRRVRPMPPPCRSVSGAATEGNSLRQGIFSYRHRPLSDLSISDRNLGDFPGAGNREISGSEQRPSNAEQGINTAHHRASSCVKKGAVCNAIAAIFAAFMPATPYHDDDGSESWTVGIIPTA